MARDDFPSRAKLQLALRVNYRCSNPNCRASTSGPKLAPGASISIGVTAHITAASTGGPRFNPGLRSQDRSSAENGIWLCQNCGKLVDNDEVRFPEVLLREWKSWAEAEAREQLGKQASDLASVTVLDSIHGQLRRESNSRFGFSFAHPLVWDRQDPTNGDGNTYRDPQDSRIELRAWGGYAIISPDLHSWVDWTIARLQREDGFCLLAKVPSGRHLVDWEQGPTSCNRELNALVGSSSRPARARVDPWSDPGRSAAGRPGGRRRCAPTLLPSHPSCWHCPRWFADCVRIPPRRCNLPGDVTFVVIAKQHLPAIWRPANAALDCFAARLDACLRTRSAKCVSPGLDRIGQQPVNRIVARRSPFHYPTLRAVNSYRHLDALVNQPERDLGARCRTP